MNEKWLLSLALALLSNVCSSEELISAFKKIPSEFIITPHEQHIIQNMPRATAQQVLGLCYAHSAVAIFNYYHCKYESLDCKNASPAQLASPIDMARFGRFNASSENSRTDEDGLTVVTLDLNDYKLFKSIHEGGKGTVALELFGDLANGIASQQCAPYEGIFGDASIDSGDLTEEDYKIQRAQIDKLSGFYNKYKNDCPDIRNCPASVVTAFSELNLHERYSKRLGWSLQSESYEEFLAALLLPAECARAKNKIFFEYSQALKFDFYPKTTRKNKENFRTAMSKIVAAVNSDNPVLLEGLCPSMTKSGKCFDEGTRHALVIYGYAKFCAGDKCRYGLKLHNSWGKAWQDSADATWYDAKTILDTTNYEHRSLSWFVPKQESDSPQPTNR